MDQFLIAGLGNTGDDFTNTRHNVGFRVVDMLAQKHGTSFYKEILALHTTLKIQDNLLHLIKPTTFVNHSGESIKYWLNKLNLNQQYLLVVVDDKDFPFGTIRIKPKGGDGRHNGLKSISTALLSDNYSRLRFGIGRNFEQGKQKEFVLGKWSKEEEVALTSYLSVAVEAIESYVVIGIEKTMSKYNHAIISDNMNPTF